MSDQNQWPKPGETTPSDDSAGQTVPQTDRPADPWAQSGQGSAAQGVSGGYTADQPGQQNQNQPGQQQYQPGQPNPYAQQNPYAHQAPGQPTYGQPGQQYGAPQNPYAQQQNPYGQQNPYAAPQNPYGQQQNPYGQQQNPYAAGPYSSLGYQPYAQRPKTNTLSILSIVFAFGGIIIWPLIILSSPAGAIMGHIALGKIRQSGEAGRGLALAGVIGGWVLTGLYLAGVLLFFFAIASSGHSSSSYDSGTDSGAFIL